LSTVATEVDGSEDDCRSSLWLIFDLSLSKHTELKATHFLSGFVKEAAEIVEHVLCCPYFRRRVPEAGGSSSVGEREFVLVVVSGDGSGSGSTKNESSCNTHASVIGTFVPRNHSRIDATTFDTSHDSQVVLSR